MDLRALALRGHFRLILAPYSLITYLTRPVDVDAFLTQVRELLADDGQLLLDAFIPRPVESFEDFRRDYARPHGSGALERHKRIRQLDDGCNRIERRYEVVTAGGRTVHRVEVSEVIRPVPPAALVAMLGAAGFRVAESCWDYAARETSAGAQFYTAVARTG